VTLAAGTQYRRYQIHARIGAGGMGAVYRAPSRPSSIFSHRQCRSGGPPSVLSEVRRSEAKRAPKRKREMAVTGETETECESGQVRRAWELHERTGKTQLHQVFVQRHAFHATKEIGEIGWRGTDLASHLKQSHGVR
jgi:hypothetical protein